MSKALVILSGGIDSSTCAVIGTKAQNFELSALTFDYNQRHKIEIEHAKKVCEFLGIKDHQIFKIDIGQFGGSALTDTSIEIPKRNIKEVDLTEIPSTYVPMRNFVFLSIALSYAEAKGIRTILFGANIVDYSGYPDCRPEFIEALIHAANLGSKIYHQDKRQTFKILTPLMFMTKIEVVKLGLMYGFDYSLTYSCYAGGEKHCHKCDSCQFRYEAFSASSLFID